MVKPLSSTTQAAPSGTFMDITAVKIYTFVYTGESVVMCRTDIYRLCWGRDEERWGGGGL